MLFTIAAVADVIDDNMRMHVIWAVSMLVLMQGIKDLLKIE